MQELSHLNGDNLNMVDVGSKSFQKRTAIAQGRISLSPDTLELIKKNHVRKGNVLTAAKIAGIQAAKHTANLIPLCHPLLITWIDVSFEILDTEIIATSKVINVSQTGVEMEALTAISIALLTIYDMCKAVDKTMRIIEIYLVTKEKENVKKR